MYKILNGTKVKNLNLSEMDLVNLDSIPMIYVLNKKKQKIQNLAAENGGSVDYY